MRKLFKWIVSKQLVKTRIKWTSRVQWVVLQFHGHNWFPRWHAPQTEVNFTAINQIHATRLVNSFPKMKQCRKALGIVLKDGQIRKQYVEAQHKSAQIKQETPQIPNFKTKFRKSSPLIFKQSKLKMKNNERHYHWNRKESSFMESNV